MGRRDGGLWERWKTMNKKIFLELILILLLLICSIWFCYHKYTNSKEKYYRTRPIIVTAGDTLWSIAKREFPSSEWDIREVIYYIQLANPGLDAGRLQRGQEIKLPVFFSEEVENDQAF